MIQHLLFLLVQDQFLLILEEVLHVGMMIRLLFQSKELLNARIIDLLELDMLTRSLSCFRHRNVILG